MKLITAKTKADKMGPMEKPAELESVEAKVEVRPAVKIVPTASEETKPVETVQKKVAKKQPAKRPNQLRSS